jgi:hypothetical protein
MSITSRKRILSSLFLEEPDRVPFGPFISTSWLEIGGKDVIENMLGFTDPLISYSMGGNIFLGERAEEVVKVTREGDLVKTVVQTPKGNLRSITKTTHKMSLIKEYLLKSFDDIEKFLSVQYEAPNVDSTSQDKWSRRIGEKGLLLAGTANAVMIAAANGFGPAGFCMKCLQDLPRIREFVTIGATRVENYVQSLINAGAEAIRIIGAEYVSPTFLNPRFFKELVVPFDRRLMRLIKDESVVAHMHCHGKIGAIIGMIRQIAPNAIDPLERPPGGDVTLDYVKKTLGDKMGLVGNLDDLNIFSAESWSVVKKEVLSCMSMAAEGGGYVLSGTASGKFTEAMYENFIRTGKLMKRMGRHKRSYGKDASDSMAKKSKPQKEEEATE